MRSLIHTSMFITGIRVIGIVLQSLIVVYLARSISIADMGVFALCYASFSFSRMLGPLGTDQVTMRHVARAREQGSLNQDVHRLLNTSFICVVLVSTLIASILILISSPIVSEATGYTGITSNSLFWIGIGIPAFSLNGLFTYQLRGFDYKVIAQLPDSVLIQLLFGAGLLFLNWQGMLNLQTVLATLTMAAWLTAIMYLFIRSKVGVQLLLPNAHSFQALFTESKEVFSALLVTALSVRAPLFISAALLGPAATAVLDIANRFGTLPSITTTSVAATFSPQFAAQERLSSKSALSRTLSLASLLALIPAVGCLMTIAIGAPIAIDKILPEAYAEAYVPMLIICLGLTANACFGLTSNLLMMSGKSRIVRNYTIMQLTIIVLLSILLGKVFGATGIAIAILLGKLIRDVGLAFWSVTHLGIKLPPFGIFQK